MPGARRIVIETRPGEVRAAVLDGRNNPVAFRVERDTARSLTGAVLLGRVRTVRRDLGAAFVDIGDDADGFLNIRGSTGDACGTALAEGAAVLVQIGRDATVGKGAQLGTAIDIPGAALVLTPGRPGLGLSARIGDDDARARLKSLFADEDFSADGLVVRTGARDMADADIVAEYTALQARWRDLRDGLAKLSPPTTVIPAPAFAERIVSRFAGPETQEIIADDADTLARLGAHLAQAPAWAGTALRMADGGAPAFRDAGIEDAFEAALSPHVALPGGGALIVSETPAMTAVDVNAGRAQGGDPERLALDTNLQAAVALAETLMLRGIGGLIAVDFLKMRDDANRKRVLSALVDAFKGDTDKPRIGDFSRFGIVDIVRQSHGPSLAGLFLARTESMTPESAALEALARIERRGGSGARLHAAPEVCTCLDGPLAEIRKKLEHRLGFVIALEAVPGAATSTLEIETP